MTPALLTRPRGAPRALVSCLALLAALGAPPAASGAEFFDSFETWPGTAWTVQVNGANALIARPPGQPEGPSTRASGAWDGRQALRVQYAGSSGSARAEAIASYPGTPMGTGALRLMLYVPSSTRFGIPPGGQVRIARLMGTATDSGAILSLFLARGGSSNDRLYVYAEYLQLLGLVTIGTPTSTGIAPDTWHTIELRFDANLLGSVELFVDDLSQSRASGGGLNLSGNVGAVAVGLAGQAASAALPLVWWIDDVKLSPDPIGHGSPRYHFHQDGFEAPNISAYADPAGKSLVSAGGGSVTRIAAGRRDGGMEVYDPSGSSQVLTAAYGELTGMDAGNRKLYHRVWWRQGNSSNSTVSSHSVVAIASSDFGGVEVLSHPMAAISVGPNGALKLWGWSLDAGAPWRDPEQPFTGPLSPGWHLLELEVVGFGTATGARYAFVDGQLGGQTPANWTGIAPTQWIDGQPPDAINIDYIGRDQYDESRTSPFAQPSRFALDGGISTSPYLCTPVDILALDSFGNPAPVPEDAVLTFDNSDAGTFWRDPICGDVSGPLPALLAPAGTTGFRVYFLPLGAVIGNAAITLEGPDYPPHTSYISIQAVPPDDTFPPTSPGQPIFATLVTRSPVDVSWKGSSDDAAGSGLWGYEVHASRNDGGWLPWVDVPWPAPDADAGFRFDAGESYWRLRVRARDDAGNVSPFGPESDLLTVDRTAPPQPGAPQVTLGAGGNTADVSWTQVIDQGPSPSGVAQYRVSVLDQASGATTPVFVDRPPLTWGVTPGNTYTFRVAALDVAGNESGPSQQSTVVVPGPISALRLLGLGAGNGVAVKDWAYPVAVEAIDGAGNVVTDYRGTVVFGAQAAAGGSNATLPAGGTYTFTAADQGRHTFEPGFAFHAVGPWQASVFDQQDSTLRADVALTVISPGEVRVIHDANPYGTVDVPYLYNAAGAVRAVSSVPVTFSTCGGPSDFLVDRNSGAVRWVPSTDDAESVSICVKAETGGGQSDSYTFTVTLLPSSTLGPTADFSVSPSLTDVGTPALFDPTASRYFPGPPVLRWRFGDGSLPATRDRPLHPYWLPGGYRPALTLFDALGRSDRTAREVRIRDSNGNEPPSLAIQTPPQTGRDSLPAQLSAAVLAGSSAPGVPRWELGNGAYADGLNVSATYGPGRTWATAVVVDGHGLPATDKVEIAVTEGDKVPPFCMAAADPPVAFISATTGRADVAFHGLSAPGSKELSSVSWMIDGVPAAQAVAPRSYSTPGWHRGALTVVDGNGLRCTDSVVVLVLGGGAGGSSIPPRILDPGLGGQAECGQDYAGRPALASGAPALTWSLVDPPAGMTIDASTGAVSWRPPVTTATTTAVNLQVSGPTGIDRVSANLPISCRTDVALTTNCGCGTAGGGPAFAGLFLLFGLWSAARFARRPRPEGRRRFAPRC